MVTCGHRGQPNRAEEKRISRLMRKSGYIPMLEELSQQRKDQNEFKFDKAVEEEEKKTQESGEKSAQYQRVGSKGKGLMPKIQVIQPPQPTKGNKSPLHEIVIDMEETMNPLSFSQRSSKRSKSIKPKQQIEEETPDPGQDSDEGAVLKVQPIDVDFRFERNKSQTAETSEMLTGKHPI